MRARLLPIAMAVAALALLPALSGGAPGDPVRGFGSNGTATLGADTRILAAATQQDGKLVVVGDAGEDAGQIRLRVARFTAAGRPDNSFSGGNFLGPVGTTARAIAIQPDGKIVVAGKRTDPSGQTNQGMLVMRLTRGGAPDRSFSGDGTAEAFGSQEGQALGVTLQRDGRIVASGAALPPGAGTDGFERMAAARFRPNGSLDGSFGQGGTVLLIQPVRISFANAVAVQPNGRIILAGSHRDNLQSTEVYVTRLTANGGIDTGFDGDGFFIQQFAEAAAFSSAYGVALAPGGKIVLGGTATSASAGSTALAVRLNAGGALDRSFGGDGSVLVPATTDRDQFLRNPNPGARAMTLSGGDVILAGHFDDLGVSSAAVWALRPNGALDGRFGQGGRTVFALQGQSQFNALAAAPDGSLLAGGIVRPSFLGPPSGLVAKLAGFPVRGPKCLGKASTIVGTAGRDVLRGTGRRDVIVGLGGPDRIIARGGNDLACGGGGNDRIDLGAGNDSGSGGPGRDVIAGGGGRDRLLGNAGVDRLFGGPGNDRLIGGGGRDVLNGGPGRNNVSQ